MKWSKDNIRTIVFGLEDALVSKTGLAVGLLASGLAARKIVIATLIAVLVGATSMAAGEFIIHDDAKAKRSKAPTISAFLMLISYLISGLWVILPILIGANFIIELIFGLASLYTLGFMRAKLLGLNPRRGGMKTLIAGSIAMCVGITVGMLLKIDG